MQVRLAMKRRFQLQMGDLPTLMITTIAAIFQVSPFRSTDPRKSVLIDSAGRPITLQAIIIGSVYFQMPKDTSGFFSRGGGEFGSTCFFS